MRADNAISFWAGHWEIPSRRPFGELLRRAPALLLRADGVANRLSLSIRRISRLTTDPSPNPSLIGRPCFDGCRLTRRVPISTSRHSFAPATGPGPAAVAFDLIRSASTRPARSPPFTQLSISGHDRIHTNQADRRPTAQTAGLPPARTKRSSAPLIRFKLLLTFRWRPAFSGVLLGLPTPTQRVSRVARSTYREPDAPRARERAASRPDPA